MVAVQNPQTNNDWTLSDPDVTDAGSGHEILNYDPGATSPQDYNNVGWGRAAASGASTLFPSLVRSAISVPVGLYEAATHPIEAAKGTARNIAGAASKLESAVGYPDPAMQPYEKDFDTTFQNWESPGGIKKMLAENPSSLLAPAGVALAGGESAFAGMGSDLSKASKAGKAARIAKGVTLGLANPTDAALSGAGLFGRLAGEGVASAASLGSKIGKGTMESIQDVYGSNPQYISDYERALNGSISESDTAQRMRAAAEAASKQTSQKWLSDAKNAMALNTSIDYQPVIDAIGEQQKRYHSALLPNGQPDPMAKNYLAANAALSEAIDQVKNVRASRNNMTDLEKFNDLKQSLYDLSERQQDPSAQAAVKGVWSAVRKQLFDASPEYGKLMEGYQDYLQGKTDFAKGLALGPKTSAGTTINKVIKNSGAPFQQGLLQSIYDQDPGLRYQIAGHDVRRAKASSETGNRGIIDTALTLGGAMGAMWDHPILGGTAAAAAGMHELARPSIVAGANKAIGKAAPYVSPVSSAAKTGAIRAAPLTTNIQNSGAPQTWNSDWTLSDPGADGQANGGRVERKSGGRTSTNPISAEVNRVRILLRNKTQHMLSVPDDAVATALNMAKNR